MKNLALISAIMAILGLTACAPKITKGFHKTGETVISMQDLYPFWEQHTQLFNMKIDFRKNHFSGLLLVKYMALDSCRIVFNSHFGMGIFDFEFVRDTFHVHSCLKLLNTKKILNLFEKNFRTLLFLDVQPHANVATVYHTLADSTLAVNRVNGRYYLKNDALKTLLKIEVPHCFGVEHYSFTDYRNNFPEVIAVKHSAIGLQLTLEKIPKIEN
jgi:hypothetical protein